MQSKLQVVEHVVAGAAILYSLNYIRTNGLKSVVGSALTGALNVIPGAAGAVEAGMEKDVENNVKELFPKVEGVNPLYSLPKEGLPKDEIFKLLTAMSQKDCNPAKTFALAYETGDDGSHHEFLEKVTQQFMWGNALNPMAFPSLRKMENDCVSMTLDLFNAPKSGRGTMTSGGTESLLMAVKAYRDYAKKNRGITEPEMILAESAHPALHKAGAYFGVKVLVAKCPAPAYVVDVDQVASLITANTILLVGSASSYPHGVVDPIVSLASLAKRKGLPLHVDACIGGFYLPFAEKLGEKTPLWDYRVDGVTSISADLHKYGYSAKGASIITYVSDDYRQHQFYAYSEWTGGLFASPSALGSRGGGAIAAAWASMVVIGESGYLKLSQKVLDTKAFMLKSLKEMDGISIIGSPDSSIIAFTNEKYDIMAISDVMENVEGWKVERQQNPSCIHLTVMPQHEKTKEAFVAALIRSIAHVKEHPELANTGTAAIYGMVAKVPSPELVETFLKKMFLRVFTQDHYDEEGSK
eukprot:TRINITY_DN3884_c0_g1_i1.p1 TRINITY_DN3884_c0_g1~~TRINITY_DN3884_c0_g1_i1.p1  ORF type:complete len:525 (-),score=149.79 TRINITY_DN3884_c0_g1_i1:1370-2944(-)